MRLSPAIRRNPQKNSEMKTPHPPKRLLAALALCAAALSPLRAASPQLVWSDEFNPAGGGGARSLQMELYDLGVGKPAGLGQQRAQRPTPIRAATRLSSRTPPPRTARPSRSARRRPTDRTHRPGFQTGSAFSFTYGRLEARAKVPAGIGCWPAFWALGTDIATAGWPACGEIDVMEWVGQAPSHIKGSLHATGYSGAIASTPTFGASRTTQATSDAYHVFAVDWYPDQIVFSMDGAVPRGPQEERHSSPAHRGRSTRPSSSS